MPSRDTTEHHNGKPYLATRTSRVSHCCPLKEARDDFDDELPSSGYSNRRKQCEQGGTARGKVPGRFLQFFSRNYNLKPEIFKKGLTTAPFAGFFKAQGNGSHPPGTMIPLIEPERREGPNLATALGTLERTRAEPELLRCRCLRMRAAQTARRAAAWRLSRAHWIASRSFPGKGAEGAVPESRGHDVCQRRSPVDGVHEPPCSEIGQALSHFCIALGGR